MKRTDFLKNACSAGACLCGFGSVAVAAGPRPENSGTPATPDGDNPLIQEWLNSLLGSLNVELDAEQMRLVLKKTALVHYDQLKMEPVLAEYKGDLDRFIAFLEKEWGWKISFDKTTGTLIADENKSYCVCPVSAFREGIDQSAMCYCSEGFAEKMFTTVTGSPAIATVIASVRRGDPTCKYQVTFPELAK